MHIGFNLMRRSIYTNMPKLSVYPTILRRLPDPSKIQDVPAHLLIRSAIKLLVNGEEGNVDLPPYKQPRPRPAIAPRPWPITDPRVQPMEFLVNRMASAIATPAIMPQPSAAHWTVILTNSRRVRIPSRRCWYAWRISWYTVCSSWKTISAGAVTNCAKATSGVTSLAATSWAAIFSASTLTALVANFRAALPCGVENSHFVPETNDDPTSM